MGIIIMFSELAKQMNLIIVQVFPAHSPSHSLTTTITAATSTITTTIAKITITTSSATTIIQAGTEFTPAKAAMVWEMVSQWEAQQITVVSQ